MITARTTGLRILGMGLLASLSACGGGGGGSSPAPTPPPAPPATFTVSATVSGLAGSGLVLRNNGGNDTAVSANGTVAFSTVLGNGAAYAVTVQTQPSTLSQTCAVSNGSGTISGANVTNVTINCQTNNYTISAEVSGLVGGGLVLRLNGAEDLAISGSGLASFATPRASGSNYSVVVDEQPVDYTCGVPNPTGTVTSANVSFAVSCLLNAPDAPQVSVTSFTKRVGFDWPAAARAAYYRVYKTRNTDTDFQLLSGDITVRTFSEELGVHLENWPHLRYRIDACNTTGCSTSQVIQIHPVPSTFGSFKASNTRHDDWFGLFTAISGDGNTVAIAAPWEDSGSTTINGNQFTLTNPESGAVYVFVRDPATNSWDQQAHIKASTSYAGLTFGWGVTLSHDGNTLAVGVHADSTGANLSGSVYVYSRAGTTWSEQAYLRASNLGQDDQFGLSLAISGDGNTLLVGAPYESSWATGVGTSQTDNNAPNSGAAYVFTRAAGNWTETAYLKSASTDKNSDAFGNTVAISADGNTLAVSAPGEDSDATGSNGDESNYADPDSGAVYMFVRSGGSWVQQAFLKGPVYAQRPSHPAHHLGAALALSGNGDTLVVSSTIEDTDAVGINGTPTSAVVTESGAAYVFTRNAGAWAQQAFLKASNPDAQDMFGFSLDISDDGNIVAVGARGEASASEGVGGDQNDNSTYATGAVYSFRREGTTWQQLNYLHARDTDLGDMLGVSMGMSADGKSLIVGAYAEDGVYSGFNMPGDNNGAPESGAAYIF